LRSVWLLVVPFFWFARPTLALLLGGAALMAIGLGVRAWAAGVIRKDAVLTTSGPYAYTRNPLYLGSLFLGLGVVVAGGQWLFAAVFLLFFVGVYGRTVRHEATLLGDRFGEAYHAWAAQVPLFVPRLTPYRPVAKDGDTAPWGFTGERWTANREYEALAGALAALAVLVAKWLWTSGAF